MWWVVHSARPPTIFSPAPFISVVLYSVLEIVVQFKSLATRQKMNTDSCDSSAFHTRRRSQCFVASNLVVFLVFFFERHTHTQTHNKTREFTNRGKSILKKGVVDRGLCVLSCMGTNGKTKTNKIKFFFAGQELNANSDRPYRELPTEYS